MEISKKKKEIKKKKEEKKGERKNTPGPLRLMSINNLLYISLITDEYLYL